MTNTPRAAICLAVYNGSEWLVDQITTIFGQNGVYVTIFVSVDKSVDGSEALVDQLAKSDNRIKIMAHGRQFGGAAPNFFRIISETDFSDFDYVCFADQDDLWQPDKLVRAHEKLLSTGADAYSSNVIAFWPDQRHVIINKSQKQVEWDFLFEAAGPGCTYVMKKDLVIAAQAVIHRRWAELQRVGLHDWFMYAFARANGFQWIIDDYAGMLYRQHENNQIGVNSGWKALLYRARKVYSGWGLTQSALIADLVGLGSHQFVARWSNGSRVGLVWLACNALKCRRRSRDKWFFALSCLALCSTRHRFR